MWWVGYDGYTNMYENINVRLYFIDFVMYLMAVIFTSFFVWTWTQIWCIQLKVFFNLQYRKHSMPWSVMCATRNVAWWWPFTVWPGSPKHMPHQDLCPTNATQPTPGLAAANRGRDGTRPHRLLIGIGLCGIGISILKPRDLVPYTVKIALLVNAL